MNRWLSIYLLTMQCALDYNAPFTAILAGELELGKLPYFARQSGSTSEEAA
jgi:hypothetical protein